jgi:hypothetical protein
MGTGSHRSDARSRPPFPLICSHLQPITDRNPTQISLCHRVVPSLPLASEASLLGWYPLEQRLLRGNSRHRDLGNRPTLHCQSERLLMAKLHHRSKPSRFSLRRYYNEVASERGVHRWGVILDFGKLSATIQCLARSIPLLLPREWGTAP